MLEYLLKFIETGDELNPVLSGYFSKLLLILVNSKQDDFIEYIYTVNPTVLPNLCNHIYNKSISEVFVKIMLIDKF